ncbi:MAG TPA: hypothetical protein VK514_00905, partial [Candidatus Acidoferrum sp.]|nr:hypothetical protein [Candidatus Acidoferrum sp.]
FRPTSLQYPRLICHRLACFLPSEPARDFIFSNAAAPLFPARVFTARKSGTKQTRPSKTVDFLFIVLLLF